MLSQPDASANRLLRELPESDRRRLVRAAEPAELALRQVVMPFGRRIDHVYFPTGSFISGVVPGDKGKLEVALVGSEGMLGLPLALGVELSHVEGVVQGAGPALRIDAASFRRELQRSAALRDALGRYAAVQLAQLGRNAHCNRFHRVSQRLARWLLMSSDRARSPAFEITHAFLAHMLGVRRVGVTTAARALQADGFIEYTRGRIFIRDCKGLQGVACSCYRADLDTYRAIFPS